MMTSTVTPHDSRAGFHRNLYILVAGVFLGMLAGPGVFGRIAPDAYQQWFPDWRHAQARLLAFEREQGGIMQRLADTGVSETALLEYDQVETAADRRELLDELARGRARLGMLHALVAAVVAIVVLEALTQPGAAIHQKLATGRYAILAGWIALVLAQPHILAEVPMAFTGMLVLFVLIASLTPLGRRAKPAA